MQFERASLSGSQLWKERKPIRWRPIQVTATFRVKTCDRRPRLRRRLVQNVSQAKGIQPGIQCRRSRLEPIKYDKRQYRRRSRIQIMSRRPKDRRRVAPTTIGVRWSSCPPLPSPPPSAPGFDQQVLSLEGYIPARLFRVRAFNRLRIGASKAYSARVAAPSIAPITISQTNILPVS